VSTRDHEQPRHLLRCLPPNGFTSVMMDGSLEADAQTPAQLRLHVAVTKEVVDLWPIHRL